MCGIAGIWSSPDDSDSRKSIDGMIEALRRRGPDDRGRWSDEEAGIHLGHTRLAIIDISPQGHQPMRSACGRYVMVYNGEIYNHRELRRQLDWPHWRGQSDTETVLACLSAYGLRGTLSRIAGMFAFAVWDRQLRRLTMARDRMGEKPLYYGRIGNGALVFGSELNALRAHAAWVGDIDRESVALLLRHNCVPAPRSIYRGIRKLMPGTAVIVGEDGSESVERYWDLAALAHGAIRDRVDLSDAEAIDRLESQLAKVVRAQMLSDVPLGAFLSGGVDSSAIVALMSKQCSQKVKTFSIGFESAAFDEAVHAKAVARHLDTEHNELYMTGQDALAVVPELGNLYDEPFADASQIPTYLVCRMARRKVTVALSGDGGDELFAGYTRYKLAKRTWHQLSNVPLPLRRGFSKLVLATSPAAWERLARVPMAFVPRRKRPGDLGDKLHKFATGVLPSETPWAMYQALTSHWGNPSSVVRLNAEPVTLLQDPGLLDGINDPVERMTLIDQLTYLPDDILVKVDRAAMSVGLETRVPLLDHRIVELAWQTPMHQKLRGGQSKWLLRQVLYRHVPQSLIERPKQGFSVPLAQWLRGPLRDWAENLLDGARLNREQMFDVHAVRTKWSEHLSGARNWQFLLWDVLMYQAWLEKSGEVAAAIM